jgi:hypothetical protein
MVAGVDTTAFGLSLHDSPVERGIMRGVAYSAREWWVARCSDTGAA